MIDPSRFVLPLLRKIAVEVAEKRADRAATIVLGKLPDAEYRFQAGFVAGLDAALEIAREVDKQVDGEAPKERR